MNKWRCSVAWLSSTRYKVYAHGELPVNDRRGVHTTVPTTSHAHHFNTRTLLQ